LSVTVPLFSKLWGTKNPPILKGCWVCRHIGITTWRQLATDGIRAPELLVTSPVATKGRVEDEVHVHEMAIDIAATAALEERQRCAPLVGRGRLWARVRTGGQVRWGSGGAREEPDLDVRGRPFGGVDAAAAGVKARTERHARGGRDAAAFTGVKALTVAQGAGLQGGLLGWHGAAERSGSFFDVSAFYRNTYIYGFVSHWSSKDELRAVDGAMERRLEGVGLHLRV
jgi:hypothetical protein